MSEKTAVYPGTFFKAHSSEFSGTWNITALLAKKDDGSFYSPEELAGPAEQKVNAGIPMNEQQLIGVVQHRGESAGAIAELKADQGGQILMFSLNLPE